MKYRIAYESIKLEMLFEPAEIKILNDMAIAFTKDQSLTHNSILESLVKKIAQANDAMRNEQCKVISLT